MKYSLITAALLGLTMTSVAMAEVTPVPLAQDNMPAVGEFSYSPGDTIPVPLITWGGDMPTILANGNAAKTQAGSIFGRDGLSVELYREDAFAQQLRSYLAGETPFLRGTVGMIAAASEAACNDNRTCPEVIYNISRSAGGDSLVAKPGINTLGDLRGQNVCLQANGPHTDLLVASLASAGMGVNDVNVKWFADLGFDGTSSAAHALQTGVCDASFVIYPDMLELLEGDGKVSGAKEVFSTANLDQVIYDVYAVRPDFAQAYPEVVEKIVSGMLQANEEMSRIMKVSGDPSLDDHASQSAEYRAVAAAGASLLFSVEGDITFDNTVMEMYAFDLKMQGWTGNVNFVTENNATGAVWLGSVSTNANQALIDLGLLSASGAKVISAYTHDWEALKSGLSENFGVEAPRLDAVAVARVVEGLGVQDLQDRTITELVVTFEPNQVEFSAALYASEFERVLNAMAPSSGPVVVVTGHTGTVQYLLTKYGRNAQPAQVWAEIAQSAKNTSRERSVNVIEALREYADANGYDVSFEGVVAVGRGIEEPNAGMCVWVSSGVQDPCGPNGWSGQATNKPTGASLEQLDAGERRVIFRVVNVASEASVFADDSF